MSENLQKLIGVVAMAVLVVVGVAVSSGDDTDFTRNTAFTKGGVIAKDAGAEKGGDCCDEALYRIGKIEDRLSQIEASLQQVLRQVDGALAQHMDPVDRIVAAIERLFREPDEQSAMVVSGNLSNSGLLVGFDVETAREVAVRLGLGFDHHQGVGSQSDGEGFWSTRTTPGDPRRVKLLAFTEDGLVTGFMILADRN